MLGNPLVATRMQSWYPNHRGRGFFYADWIGFLCMDGFPGQTTKQVMQQQSLSARRYELEKRIDELFRAMAVEIATLFIEHGHELDHTHLRPYYAELREVNHEIKNLLTIPSSLQHKHSPSPQQQLPIPELPRRLQHISFQNQTYTTTASSTRPRSMKIKIRVIDDTRPQNDNGQTGVYSQKELISSLRKASEDFTAPSDNATVSPVVEESTPLLIIKPAKRFI